MANLIKVSGTKTFMGTEIPVVLGGFGRDKKCISDKTIAEIHKQPAYEIRRRITENIKRFKNGIDSIDLIQRMGQSQTLELLNDLGYSKQSITQAEHIYILSERGYAKLIKIMDSDLAWEIHDKLIDEYFELREEKRQSETDISKRLNAEARAKNAQVRKAREYLRLAEKYNGQSFAQILDSYATVELSGEHLIPLPQLETKTYSATEIGKRLGISSRKVGLLTNQHNLKTDEYGQRFKDKSPYANKEVDTFRYYENIIPVLESMLKQ